MVQLILNAFVKQKPQTLANGKYKDKITIKINLKINNTEKRIITKILNKITTIIFNIQPSK
jgi:hypothetical protein